MADVFHWKWFWFAYGCMALILWAIAILNRWCKSGVFVDHSSINCWACRFLSMLEKIARRYKRKVGRTWYLYETCIKVKNVWKYLYRAVDKDGKTVDFLLAPKRYKTVAKHFLTRLLGLMAILDKSPWIKAERTKRRSMWSIPAEKC